MLIYLLKGHSSFLSGLLVGNHIHWVEGHAICRSAQGIWHHGWSWAEMPLSSLSCHKLCNLVEAYIINSTLSLMLLDLNYVEILKVTDIDPLCPWWVKLKKEVSKISSFGKSKNNSKKIMLGDVFINYSVLCSIRHLFFCFCPILIFFS